MAPQSNTYIAIIQGFLIQKSAPKDNRRIYIKTGIVRTKILFVEINMARNFYWKMVFSPTLSEKRPVIKNQFQMKFSQIN